MYRRFFLLIALYLMPSQIACTVPRSELPGDEQISSLTQGEVVDLCEWAIDDLFGGTCSMHPCPSEPDMRAKLISTVNDCIELVVDLRGFQCNVTVDAFEECMLAQQRDLCLDEYDECNSLCGTIGLPLSTPAIPLFSAIATPAPPDPE